jgi:Ras-related protein Rab-11A
MYDYMFRYILLGNSYVGKTAFTQKLTKGVYNSVYEPTIGVDYATKYLLLDNGKQIKCQLWDTAGQERYSMLLKNYYKDIAGVIMMYDITKRKSFNNLQFWIKELRNNCPEKVSVILIGNKKDLSRKRVISKQEAEIFATTHGFFHTEISVKKNEDISEPLYTITKDIYLDIDNRKKGILVNKQHKQNINIEKINKQKENCCFIC